MREVYVTQLPGCDFCYKKAEYDGKTIHGCWAYMCVACFVKHGTGLGLGRGQMLILEMQKKDIDSIKLIM